MDFDLLSSLLTGEKHRRDSGFSVTSTRARIRALLQRFPSTIPRYISNLGENKSCVTIGLSNLSIFCGRESDFGRIVYPRRLSISLVKSLAAIYAALRALSRDLVLHK